MSDDHGLLERYATEVAAFRKFCIEGGEDLVFEETNFKDLSLGFFIALGVTGSTVPEDNGAPFSDAYRLATITRYTLQYWEGESL